MRTNRYAGGSKRPSSKAAASEEAKRTGDPLLFEMQRVNRTESLLASDPLHEARKQWVLRQWVPQRRWRTFSASC